MKKRYLVEFGTGVDIHGTDLTKAAQRALKDSISHCCMCGIDEILHKTMSSEELEIDVTIAAPFPDKVDAEAVAAVLPPYKHIKLRVIEGGTTTEGIEIPELGDGNTIVIVNAVVVVWIDADFVAV